MTDEQTIKETWREVGRQFQALGESLAQAFRAAWEDEENRQHLQGMQAGLETMVKEINRAVEEANASPEGQKVRREAKKAVQSARTAGAQAWQEARPHLISALRQASVELQKVVSKLEEE